VRELGQFRGASGGELAAWRRRLLARQLAHADRDLRRDKRDADRERSLEAPLASTRTPTTWRAFGRRPRPSPG